MRTIDDVCADPAVRPGARQAVQSGPGCGERVGEKEKAFPDAPPPPRIHPAFVTIDSLQVVNATFCGDRLSASRSPDGGPGTPPRLPARNPNTNLEVLEAPAAKEDHDVPEVEALPLGSLDYENVGEEKRRKEEYYEEVQFQGGGSKSEEGKRGRDNKEEKDGDDDGGYEEVEVKNGPDYENTRR